MALSDRRTREPVVVVALNGRVDASFDLQLSPGCSCGASCFAPAQFGNIEALSLIIERGEECTLLA